MLFVKPYIRIFYFSAFQLRRHNSRWPNFKAELYSPLSSSPKSKSSMSNSLGSGDSNPHWFHIAIFPVTAVNPLKIRQYSLRNLLCYRKNCLCETASTCSAEFLQRISVRKGAGGLTPVKADKPEGFVKIQPTGNASSALPCLSERGKTYGREKTDCTS